MLFISLLFTFSYSLHLQIYMESQCRDSHQLLKSLSKLLDYPDLLDQLEIEFIIFGKGSQIFQNFKWNFECQHGKLECDANLLENCIIQQLEWREQLQFLSCMHLDKKRSMVEYEYYAEKCTKEFECVFEKAQRCVNSKFGNYMQHKAATLTLQQQLTRVPWVLVDGEHDLDVDIQIQRHMWEWICGKIKCPSGVGN